MRSCLAKGVVALCIVLWGLFGCAMDFGQRPGGSDAKVYGKTKGSFRGRWWNYYERGVSHADGKKWTESEADLREAVRQRQDDHRRARTYGMHFIDYFPHRELGVAFYHQGRYEEAIGELEASLRTEKSAKAEFYLDGARKALIEEQGRDSGPPEILLSSPAPESLTNAFSWSISGVARDDTYVKRVEVNGAPVRVDLGAPELLFRLDVPLKPGVNPLRVLVTDLTGKTRVVERSIRVDRLGPVLSIDEPVEGRSGSMATLRLKGYVYDESPLREVKVNGTALAFSGGSEVKLDRSVPIGSGAEGITIEAVDQAGNQTRADIRLSSERHRVQQPVRLASLVMPWLAMQSAGEEASDGAGPVIELRNWTSDQTVFLDQAYIEGSVRDEAGVRQLEINGQSVLKRPGKRVYFAHLTDLREGENVFRIEARGVSGSRSEKEIRINRKIRKVRQVGSRLSVALLPFERKGVPGLAGETLEENLLGVLIERGRFEMVERSRLDEILREQKLSRTDLADQETAIRVGRIMAAGCVLLGSVAEKEGSLEVYAHLVDTETSRILTAVDVYGEDADPGALRRLCQGLVLKFCDELPLVDGLVVQARGGQAVTDLGRESRIKKGMRLIIYEEGEPVTHPVTGAVLGEDTEQIGRAIVLEVHEKMSDAEILDKTAQDRVKPMQKVITQ